VAHGAAKRSRGNGSNQLVKARRFWAGVSVWPTAQRSEAVGTAAINSSKPAAFGRATAVDSWGKWSRQGLSELFVLAAVA